MTRTLLDPQLLDPRRRHAAMLDAFHSHWDATPTMWARAPGRVDLMGSHTDYNEGYVLTLSIDRDTWVAARPVPGTTCRVHSLNLHETHTFQRGGRPVGDPHWHTYVEGVALVLLEAGYDFPAFDLVIHGTVPIASGLSSSASLEAAIATVLEQLGGHAIDRVEMARMCQRAENRVVGVNCGILDQYSSILGRHGQALLLDCRDLTCSHAPVADSLRVVIADTRAPRRLSGSEYGERRGHCEQAALVLAEHDRNVRALRDVSPDLFAAHRSELSPVMERRCRFVLEENQRVLDMACALHEDDRAAIGRLCAESYAGARDLYQITVPAMDAMIHALNAAPGIVGARQAGAGFGGCMVAIVNATDVQEFCAAVKPAYREATDIEPEIYPVAIAAGAGLLQEMT